MVCIANYLNEPDCAGHQTHYCRCMGGQLGGCCDSQLVTCSNEWV